MNNPTLDDFCDNMIGRADIEESKSNCNHSKKEKAKDCVCEIHLFILVMGKISVTMMMMSSEVNLPSL